AVSRFDNLNPKNDQDHLCAAACDEVALRLNAYNSVEAQRVAALEETNHGTRYGFHVSLACYRELLRLNVTVSDLQAGQIISCETVEGPRDAVLKLSQQAADSVVHLLRAQARQPIHRESHVARTHSTTAKVGSTHP